MKKEIKNNKKPTMADLTKNEQFPPSVKSEPNKLNIPNKSKLNEIDNLKKLEKLFIKFNYFNPNNNKKLENDTEIMSGLLNSGLIQLINYLNNNSGYNAKWIKQLFNTYEATVGSKGDYSINDKMFFAHFIEIMKLNKITKRQSIILLKHFFNVSESESKRIHNIYTDNKSDYPYTWDNRYLNQMWVLCVIIGAAPYYNFNYRGIKTETKDQFNKLISETINYFRNILEDKKFKKENSDFYKDNQFILNYITQEFRTSLEFISNLTNNKTISEIHKYKEKYNQEIEKYENLLRKRLYESNYNTEDLDKNIGANEPEIKELYDLREKEIKLYEQYYKANSQHLLQYKKFRYELVNLLGLIDHNLS